MKIIILPESLVLQELPVLPALLLQVWFPVFPVPWKLLLPLEAVHSGLPLQHPNNPEGYESDYHILPVNLQLFWRMSLQVLLILKQDI